MNKIAIAAQYSNGVIGVNNSLPFNSPTDMDYFKQQTVNNVVIMGNNTFKSLNCKPLPNRINIVVTPFNYPTESTLHVAKSPVEAIQLANLHCSDCKYFIIGGASIYRAMIPSCNELHLTVFDQPYVADQTDSLTFFPYTDTELLAMFKSKKVVSTFTDPSVSGTIYKYSDRFSTLP